jgi:hypothetical protein
MEQKVRFPSAAYSISHYSQISSLRILKPSMFYHRTIPCYCESKNQLEVPINCIDNNYNQQQHVQSLSNQQQHSINTKESTINNLNSFEAVSSSSSSSVSSSKTESCTSCYIVGVGTCTGMTAYFAYVAYEPRTALETTVAKYQQRKVFCLAVSAGWACLGIYRLYLG